MRKSASTAVTVNERCRSVEYSFTITIQPKYYKLEPEAQYDLVIKHIKEKLSTITDTVTMVAELTKNYNIHMHGLCTFYINPNKDNIKEWYKCWRNDIYVGYSNIKQCTDKPGWLEYMSKDFERTMKSLNRRPIIEDYLENYSSKDRAQYGTQW